MASHALSADFGGLVSRNLSYERLSYALRLHCGRGRFYSVPDLATATGVPSRAIECAMHPCGRSEFRPLRFEYLLSISQFLGAAFTSQYLELAGLGAFELMDGQPPLPKVLTSVPAQETPEAERRRLILRLAELEEDQ